VECVLKWEAIVGESPLWHVESARLYWVDIQSKKVHRFDPLSGKNESFTLPDIVTCLAFRRQGGLILTLRKNFAFFDPDSGALEILGAVESDLPQNRFNDGRCDPQGRFWAGTMGDKDWKAPVGNLYRLDKDGKIKCAKTHVCCSNGTAWSPDGKTMYHTETFRYTIFAYDFEPLTGEISRRRAFAEMDPKGKAFPDGLTVDAEGGVWSNHVGAGRIVRYLPDGKIDRIIEMPVPRATGCAFGGPNLDTLYITSARETMTPAELELYPLSGSLFAYSGGIRGIQPDFYG
jgi:sugar lactone lactonase YvrE